MSNSNEVEETCLGSWSDLPLDLIDLVTSRLTFVSRIRFVGVCKSWSLTRVPPQPWPFKQWPLLMYLSKDFQGDYKLFNPIVGDALDPDVEITPITRLVLRFSKDGWVLMTDEDDFVSMLNLFTKEMIDLPIRHVRAYACGFSFSSPPTSPDCVVFAINTCGEGNAYQLSFWRYGENSWTMVEKRYDVVPFLVADNNPVFHQGVFYCLGKNGNIGVFDPRTTEWIVREDPKPSHQFCSRQDRKRRIDMWMFFAKRHEERCYLVESSKGELLAVFDYNNRKPVLVMKLDQSKKAWKWTKVEDLETETIFVDTAGSCISIATPLRGIGNRIYYSRYFCDDNGNPREGAYYSLKTKKYYCNPKYELREKTNCVWVMAPQFLE